MYPLFVSLQPAPDKEPGNQIQKMLKEASPKTQKRWAILAEQILNSLIVGGIAGLSTLAAGDGASLKVAIIAFGITALTELRKYRNIT